MEKSSAAGRRLDSFCINPAPLRYVYNWYELE